MFWPRIVLVLRQYLKGSEAEDSTFWARELRVREAREEVAFALQPFELAKGSRIGDEALFDCEKPSVLDASRAPRDAARALPELSEELVSTVEQRTRLAVRANCAARLDVHPARCADDFLRAFAHDPAPHKWRRRQAT